MFFAFRKRLKLKYSLFSRILTGSLDEEKKIETQGKIYMIEHPATNLYHIIMSSFFEASMFFLGFRAKWNKHTGIDYNAKLFLLLDSVCDTATKSKFTM